MADPKRGRDNNGPSALTNEENSTPGSNGSLLSCSSNQPLRLQGHAQRMRRRRSFSSCSVSEL